MVRIRAGDSRIRARAGVGVRVRVGVEGQPGWGLESWLGSGSSFAVERVWHVADTGRTT